MRDGYTEGSEVDGFRIGERIHSGAMGHIYRVTRADARFPLIMKVPRLGPGESGEGLISFETEAMILPVLSGAHVPRYVAGGDLARSPYVVTEWIDGTSLEQYVKRSPLPPDEIARVGAALADAVHSLHMQDTLHLDLKPDNAIVKPNGDVALIDFGLAFNANFPDLLAEEKRYAAGSAPYISPEQVQGSRSDPRSDLFALGVVLYELATGELPFGVPETLAGLRDRLWRDPVPPRVRVPQVPPWLQEVILRCLEPRAEDRYQSAAHIAIDLRNPDQIALSSRAWRSTSAGFVGHARRWWRHRGETTEPSRMPRAQVARTPVVLVAVDTSNPDDERQPVLQRTTAQLLALSPEYRLICVSVIRSEPMVESAGSDATASGIYHEHLVRLRHWVDPLRLSALRLSLHVIESASPEATLIEFAQRNNVDLIVVGAPHPAQLGLAWWRSVASGVTANAPCSVFVVRVPYQDSAGASRQ